jgi:membrane protein
VSSAGVPVEAGTPSARASRAGSTSRKRSAFVSLGWTLRDYAKRVWDNSSEDNVLFLAGGIAFNILLAAVPFFLLLIAGVTYLLPFLYRGQVDSSSAVSFFIDRLLPAHEESPTSPIHKLVTDILRTRTSFTIYGAIGFVWFSTRLFGSLRTVLADVFDIENERSIIQGKLFDIQLTIVATLLFVASTALNTYLTVATTRGVQFLGRLGLRHDVMGGLEYWTGRALAFVFIAWMFF